VGTRPKNIPQRVSSCLCLALLTATCLPVFAQLEETSDSELDLGSVRELRQQIEDNDGLEAGLKTRLLALYAQAINDLEAAAQAEARVEEYQREGSRPSAPRSIGPSGEPDLHFPRTRVLNR